jgi:hypothetical protein
MCDWINKSHFILLVTDLPRIPLVFVSDVTTSAFVGNGFMFE